MSLGSTPSHNPRNIAAAGEPNALRCGRQVADRVEHFAERLWRSNPLMLSAQRGEWNRVIHGRYLTNLHHFFSHTPVHLERAAHRARIQRLERLSAYYAQKHSEELGHHLWASRDLEHLDDSLAQLSLSIAPSMQHLLGYIESLVESDPQSYLAVTFLHEYLTVYLGPRWVEVLVERCGVDPSSLSAVTKHIALDAAHADAGISEIDSLISDPQAWERLDLALRDSMGWVDAWLGEIVQDGVHPRTERASGDGTKSMLA